MAFVLSLVSLRKTQGRLFIYLIKRFHALFAKRLRRQLSLLPSVCYTALFARLSDVCVYQ